jgi:hypothetical protein
MAIGGKGSAKLRSGEGVEDARLLQKLKKVFDKKVDKEGLRQATGITDELVLDRLVALNISGSLLEAFRLLPLVEIAWADGRVDKREAKAVLQAAESHGIAPGSSAHLMLENIIEQGPNPESRKAWYLYAEQLRKTLSPDELATFRRELVESANRVAIASGGILNSMFSVSAQEKKVIDAIEKALTAG